MRALLLAVLYLLSACAPTMDDLFMKANNSGDWTAVNARLQVEEEMRAKPLECRSNFILWCDSSSCSCVPKADFSDRQRELAVRPRNNHHH
jgi:hypothetical protein